mmetsp:Transcript_28295/g.74238  ORF Transcript_28295/g.74238 Transcript_28295/m.74238 type:complete len:529 (+) Transcript_28295:26-1612(+)
MSVSHATRPLPPLRRVPPGARGMQSPGRKGMGSSKAGSSSGKSKAFLQPAITRNTPRQKACLESLATGHVETFIDMFKITEGDTEGATIGESEDLLKEMKKGLIAAEDATRKGDLEAIYVAYKRLGDHFEDEGHLGTAKDFRMRAQQAAFTLGEPARLVAGHSLLGELESKIGDHHASVRCHDEAFAVAKAAGLNMHMPASHLVRAQTALGDACLTAGDPAAALRHLSSALELATEYELADLGKECCFRLGKACEALGDPHTGIDYLEKYVNSPTVDQIGKNYACEYLARCYERMGTESALDTAVQYLENLIKSATDAADTDPEQRVVAMNAASRLGRLFTRLRQYNDAIARHTLAYELAKQIGKASFVLDQQVALGKVRATAMMGHVARGYVDNGPGDLAVMLRWGSVRQDGFTAGEVTSGFESFDPEASADARRARMAEDARKRARGELSANFKAKSIVRASSVTGFIGAADEADMHRKEVDVVAFAHDEQKSHAVLIGERAVSARHTDGDGGDPPAEAAAAPAPS